MRLSLLTSNVTDRAIAEILHMISVLFVQSFLQQK